MKSELLLWRLWLRLRDDWMALCVHACIGVCRSYRGSACLCVRT